jgi:hypothetical protein
MRKVRCYSEVNFEALTNSKVSLVLARKGWSLTTLRALNSSRITNLLLFGGLEDESRLAKDYTLATKLHVLVQEELKVQKKKFDRRSSL